MADLKLNSHAAPDSVRRLPPDTVVVLEEHPDQPRFRCTTRPIDEMLAIELGAAMGRTGFEALTTQNELILQLLADAFGPDEWARFRAALREIPNETPVVALDGTPVVDEHGVPVTTVVNKAVILRELYQQLFSLYAARPTTPPAI